MTQMHAMSGARGTPYRFASVVLVLCAALLVLPAASIAVVVGTPTTTLSNPVSGLSSSYTFAGYTNNKNRQLSWADIDFPAGTDVSGATALLAGTTVTVTGPTSVRVTYTPRIPGSTAFTIAVDNIVNPAAGTYPANSVTIVCRTTNNGGAQAQDQTVATGGYTITTAPYLSLTITTPGVGQTVDFGDIDPGVTTSAQTITVEVDSSAPFTLTRTTGGDAALLGMTITGDATGSKPQGLSTFSDDLTLTPPWTTDPSVLLTATVVYTAIQ